MCECDIIFRRAVEADLCAIVKMLSDDPIGLAREVPAEPLPKVYLDAFRAISVDDNQLLVVAVNSKTIVGTMQLSFIPGIARTGMWRGQIEAVRVLKKYRNTGLGRRMLCWGIECCKEKGCGIVQLTTDKKRINAHRFYNSMGFVASHEGYKLVLG